MKFELNPPLTTICVVCVWHLEKKKKRANFEQLLGGGLQTLDIKYYNRDTPQSENHRHINETYLAWYERYIY